MGTVEAHHDQATVHRLKRQHTRQFNVMHIYVLYVRACLIQKGQIAAIQIRSDNAVQVPFRISFNDLLFDLVWV